MDSKGRSQPSQSRIPQLRHRSPELALGRSEEIAVSGDGIGEVDNCERPLFRGIVPARCTPNHLSEEDVTGGWAREEHAVDVRDVDAVGEHLDIHENIDAPFPEPLHCLKALVLALHL